MKVGELIERLTACDPDAVVVFHEFMEDGDGMMMDMEFSWLRQVTPGYAMDAHMECGDNEITVYADKGIHSQGYTIATPVIALSTLPLVQVKTNASVKALSIPREMSTDTISS